MAISHLTLDDDAALVMSAQQGDSEAFAELFRRHYAPVRRVCARRLGNLCDADEVAQAAFVKAYEKIDRCGGERRFGAWVQVIASRMCIDHVRATSRTTPHEEPVKGDLALGPNAPEDLLLQRETASQLHEALSTLPARQRQVVIARHLEDRRPGEIAAALGLTIGAVDSLLLRARRRLAVSYEGIAHDRGLTHIQATAAGAMATGAAAAVTPGRWSDVVAAAKAMAHRASYELATTLGLAPGAGRASSVARQAIVALAIGSASVAPLALPSSATPVGMIPVPELPVAVPGPPQVSIAIPPVTIARAPAPVPVAAVAVPPVAAPDPSIARGSPPVAVPASPGVPGGAPAPRGPILAVPLVSDLEPIIEQLPVVGPPVGALTGNLLTRR